MKKKSFNILIITIFGMITFLAGYVVHKHSLHYKIPVVKSILSWNTKEQQRPTFFFPGPKQVDSNLFDEKNVEFPYFFIAYGDTRELTGPAKQKIIDKIIAKKPSFVINGGDMVCYANSHNWKIFDIFEGEIIKAGIPFYPVLGNHEYNTFKDGTYSLNPDTRLAHYFKRFPVLNGKRWYSFTYGSVKFLFLDSNTDYSEGSAQYKWLLEELTGNHQGFLIVTLHHPPYTKNPKHAKRKDERFLANLFENSNEKGVIKPDIVFSSHAHNYERYKYNNVNYVVSGGGGANQHEIKRDVDDFYTGVGDTFHYCNIIVEKAKLDFKMIKLDVDSGKWTVADSFTLELDKGKK